ncbi:MAG TPA: ATP-dependent helicase, partial [Anaerolineae bacterium]|nr:ATP-dependent helicase [Anaerolineae bacterium]
MRRLDDGDPALRGYLQSRDLNPDELALLVRLYAAYRESLLTAGGVEQTDFALLQQEAYRILETCEGSDQAFQHVIVDEYQDTNTIQERLFFKLAAGTGNLCVVGDDDQALYRFRGATVENFVEFPARCRAYLGRAPRRLSLTVNYRSRERIVDFYTAFIQQADWAKGDGQDGFYRVMDKDIQAHRRDPLPAVVASTPAEPPDVCDEIAALTRRLVDEGKVDDPNQIAFLFPSLKYRGDMLKSVERVKDALEAVGLQVYAPRAGRFLEVDEAYDVFGLFLQVFGYPPRANLRGRDYQTYMEWLQAVEAQGELLMRQDPLLAKYVKEARAELVQASQDYRALLGMAEKQRWDLEAPYDPDRMKRPLYNTPRFSERGKGLLASTYLDRVVRQRAARGRPFALGYILKRVTSIDWNVLDLFYRLCGFEHFKRMFDLAERGQDEGPVSNLGLISQYLARFMEQRVPIITADLLVDKLFHKILFGSYLFALYRRGETELENSDDPFPKGRIPFLTIHQAKGLEFPVVVLANPRKDNRGPQRVELLTRPFLERPPGEPLD